MAETRRGLLAALVFGLVPVAVAQAMPAEELLVPAQYGPPPRRRRRRCWIERQRVMVRDRFGRVRPRIVEREVCRR
jgi:hypothetical protein